jgi:hypothetical protein
LFVVTESLCVKKNQMWSETESERSEAEEEDEIEEYVEIMKSKKTLE